MRIPRIERVRQFKIIDGDNATADPLSIPFREKVGLPDTLLSKYISDTVKRSGGRERETRLGVHKIDAKRGQKMDDDGT